MEGRVLRSQKQGCFTLTHIVSQLQTYIVLVTPSFSIKSQKALEDEGTQKTGS